MSTLGTNSVKQVALTTVIRDIEYAQMDGPYGVGPRDAARITRSEKARLPEYLKEIAQSTRGRLSSDKLTRVAMRRINAALGQVVGPKGSMDAAFISKDELSNLRNPAMREYVSAIASDAKARQGRNNVSGFSREVATPCADSLSWLAHDAFHF